MTRKSLAKDSLPCPPRRRSSIEEVDLVEIQDFSDIDDDDDNDNDSCTSSSSIVSYETQLKEDKQFVMEWDLSNSNHSRGSSRHSRESSRGSSSSKSRFDDVFDISPMAVNMSPSRIKDRKAASRATAASRVADIRQPDMTLPSRYTKTASFGSLDRMLPTIEEFRKFSFREEMENSYSGNSASRSCRSLGRIGKRSSSSSSSSNRNASWATRGERRGRNVYRRREFVWNNKYFT